MDRQTRNFRLLLLVAPLLLVACVFMGGAWRDPAALFQASGILSLRLWRVFLGAVIGGSLALAGVVYQAVLRNPLAEPHGLGVASGGGLGVACVLAMGLGGAAWRLPLAGFAGAIASLLVVYRLARIDGRTAPHTLILAGVAWAALCGGLLMFLATRSNTDGMHTLLWWFLGDLQAYDRTLTLAVAILNSIAGSMLVLRARRLNALVLGDDAASHLGLHAERERWMALVAASAITACCVCASGLIGFVGLVAPHAARALCGSEHRRLLLASTLLGAAFLCVSDGLGRMLLYPAEIPVGVLTALVGAPFFLRLLRNKQREIWGAGLR